MNVKLTLQLEKDIIEKAKHYARSRNQSLSSLVQNYFSFISENEKTDPIEISRNIKELSGIIKPGKDINAEHEYKKHILKKYS